MRKLYVFINLILAFSSSHVEAGWLNQLMGLEYDFSECTVIEFTPEEKKYWKRAHANSSPEGNSIVEWIPRHEVLNKHKELLTFQFFAHQNARESASSFINKLYGQMQANYPDMIWITISMSENDVVYEWILPNGIPGKKILPQHEIVRLLTTEKGMHRIAYERKTNHMDETERDLWIHRISHAPLRKR